MDSRYESAARVKLDDHVYAEAILVREVARWSLWRIYSSPDRLLLLPSWSLRGVARESPTSVAAVGMEAAAGFARRLRALPSHSSVRDHTRSGVSIQQ
jgi:hypothetical protein